MSDVTQLLSEIEQGDPSASDQLLTLVYEELRQLAGDKLAKEKPGQTLQATALVHEAYLRLVNVDDAQRWDSRGHFFAAAAEAMRRILINRARDKQRLKRGGGRQKLDLDQVHLAIDTPDETLLTLDEAILGLADEDRRCAELVKLRFFAGLNMEQTAEVLNMSPRTAHRKWAYARAWLYAFMRSNNKS